VRPGLRQRQALFCAGASNRRNSVPRNLSASGKGIRFALARNRPDLQVEIGMVLRQGPDREDQVYRMHRGDPALIHPAQQHGGCSLICTSEPYQPGLKP
jgi:hypothetical protein